MRKQLKRLDWTDLEADLIFDRPKQGEVYQFLNSLISIYNSLSSNGVEFDIKTKILFEQMQQNDKYCLAISNRVKSFDYLPRESEPTQEKSNLIFSWNENHEENFKKFSDHILNEFAKHADQ